jgi:membrane protein required for colicin V production
VNWLDAVILVLLIWFVFAAFTAGLIREVVTIASAVLGVVLAGLFYERLAGDIGTFIDSDRAARTVAFLAIFGATALAGQVVAWLLKETASMLMLGVFDHLAGAVFGLAKGVVIIQVLLLLFATYPSLGLADAIRDSALSPLFVERAPILLQILPAEFDAAKELVWLEPLSLTP